MIIWIRNIVVILFILTIIYVITSLTSRFKYRSKLKTEFEASDTKIEKSISESDFIAKGMHGYEKSLRPKLFIGVYLVPFLIMALLMYLANKS